LACVVCFILYALSIVFDNYVKEATCQQENNVADCQWVSVPVIPEEDQP
jgi:hypothetical protein